MTWTDRYGYMPRDGVAVFLVDSERAARERAADCRGAAVVLRDRKWVELPARADDPEPPWMLAPVVRECDRCGVRRGCWRWLVGSLVDATLTVETVCVQCQPPVTPEEFAAGVRA